jgi:trehalose 6-phosphate phosphatase
MPMPSASPHFSPSSAPPAPLRLTSGSALFLDFDGTLVEIAPQPELVKVPVGLVKLLGALAARLDGALAIVSGRRLADIDEFLAPLELPAAAEHGAQQRCFDGRLIQQAAPDLHDVARVARALTTQHAGLRVELKSAALALHYRHAPELESLCMETMAEVVKRTPGVELLPGKCVLEIKPSGVSKGSAIAAFMSQPPFAGRLPLFAGDDTTDEAGFASVRALGGEGIKIGAGVSLARHRIDSPAAFRLWLQSSFEGLPA